MSEEIQGKPRKQRSDAGKPRPPRILPVVETAPITVRYRLKGSAEWTEIGCSRRLRENGFHVFLRPAETNRYCEERIEVAISEVAEIRIVEAPERPGLQPQPVPVEGGPGSVVVGRVVTSLASDEQPRPHIHSVRRNATLADLESSKGPVQMDTLNGMTLGDSFR